MLEVRKLLIIFIEYLFTFLFSSQFDMWFEKWIYAEFHTWKANVSLAYRKVLV